MATSGSFETSKYGGVRGLKFNWWVNSQSTSGNYTDIGWNYVGSGSGSTWYYTLNGYLNVNGSRAYTQGSSKIQLSSGTVVASGTSRIYHNNDGTKSFGADGGATIYNYGTYQTGSGSWDLPTIPRQANITSANDFTDEQNPSFVFNNSANATLECWLEPNPNGDHLCKRTLSGTGGTYTWTLTEDERNQLRAKCLGNSCTCRIGLYSTIGGTTYASYVDKTMTVVNANPTFSSSNITYKDTNSNIVAITGNNQHIVRNLSNLKITITSATAKKSASISKYELTFNGSTKTITSAGTVDFGTINLSSNSSVSVKAIDSRGNSTTSTLSITILDWQLPTASISARRVNNYEDETNLTVQVTISSVNSKNSIQSLKYRYKKATDTTYSADIDIENNEKVVVSIDKLYIWDFQVEIKDKFGKNTYNFQVAKGMPIFMIDIDLLSIGVNCFPTNSNSLEVNGYDFNNLHPVNSIITTTNDTNPSNSVAGAWELLTSTTINSKTIYYWKRTK